MINIDEMRARQNEELELAELANKYCVIAKENGIECNMSGFSCFGIKHISIKHSESVFKKIDAKTLGLLLSVFAPTEKIRCSAGSRTGEVELEYRMDVHRGYHDRATILKVDWVHEGCQFNAEIDIDESNLNLMNFFKKTMRKLTDIEVSTYCGAKTRWNYNIRNNFDFLTWNCGSIVRFQGGLHRQICHSVVHQLAEVLKYEAQFSE
jgi:hypothetical protein